MNITGYAKTKGITHGKPYKELKRKIQSRVQNIFIEFVNDVNTGKKNHNAMYKMKSFAPRSTPDMTATLLNEMTRKGVVIVDKAREYIIIPANIDVVIDIQARLKDAAYKK